MMFFKVIAAFVVMATAVVPVAMGRASDSTTGELTVEMMIIRENSASQVREQNLFALRYTENAIGRGSAEDEVYAALERLVFSGTLTRTLARGQVANNFPDVRREAARQLGLVGSEDARAILLRACMIERDPLVLREILASLGEIASDDNALTVAVIVRAAGRNHRAAVPNNHVALAAVNALGSIAERDGGLTDSGAFWYLFAVAEGPYVTVVRERAWEVIDGLREFVEG